MAYYHHYDGQGNTLCLTDDTQTRVVERYTYTAFGERLDVLGDPNLTPFQWNGRWGYYYDEDLGEYHVRARPYAPAIARWLSCDQWIGLMAVVAPYVFVVNNPIMFVDPRGSFPELTNPPADARQGVISVTVEQEAGTYVAGDSPAGTLAGKCGAATYTVKIDIVGLPHPPKVGIPNTNNKGWVVQEISRVPDVRWCDGTPYPADKVQNYPVHFFEGFGPHAELPVFDTWKTVDEAAGTKGTITFTGTLKWWPDIDLAAERVPNGDWSWNTLAGPDPGHIPDGGYGQTHPADPPPVGWGDLPGPSHLNQMTISWYCCCDMIKEPTITTSLADCF